MESDKQIDNNQGKEKHWLWKPGQSGNPAGRPKGKTMKEYSRDYLAGMSEGERLNFMSKLKPKDIWEMAEGKADTKTDLTSKGKQLAIPILGSITTTDVSNNNSDKQDS